MSVRQRGTKDVGASNAINGVSVVMPSYNAAEWLSVTLGKIEEAIFEAGLNTKNSEIVIVDDGSKDNTKEVVKQLSKTLKVKINYIHQKNSGRYLARKNGVDHAKFEYVWFVDTRVHVSSTSLKYAVSEIKKSDKNAVWNAHVYVQKKGNIIARFMDAITYIGWRRYFKNPRRCSYGLKDFDYFPKGTTSFLVPKKMIVDAMEEFEQEEHDMQRSSDDTHLIRIISRDNPINLSPKFSCKYHARNTFKAFTKHSYHRGQVFIDGFFRPGTRFYAPIIGFLLISLATVVAMIVAPATIPWLLAAGVGVWVAELVVALLLGVNLKDALSLFALTPVFAACYGAGLWVAYLKRVRAYYTVRKNRRSALIIALVTLFFVLCTSYFYLGKASLSCATTLAAGPGDQTGLIWLNNAVNAPLWGSTQLSNAPYGESLQSPVYITGLIEYWLFWLLSQPAGPICGYNLFTAMEFLFSALVVFFFVRWLTRRTDVAVFAGFAATFTPYLQIKTGVHPSYAFFGVFVLAIWLAILLWLKPTKLKAIGLGLVMASFCLIDPYFILLGGVTMTCVLLAFVARIVYLFYVSRSDEKRRQIVKARAKAFFGMTLLAAATGAIVGLAPLVITKIQHNDQINNEVNSVRSNIKQEVMTYSARPAEYFLPNVNNPLIGNLQLPLPDILTRKPHGSNPAEDTLSLSWIAGILTIATLSVLALVKFRSKLVARLPKFTKVQLTTVGVLSVVIVGALITSFPTKSDGIVFPAEIITNYITIWRVYARLAVIVMFSIAIIAAIGLAVFTQKLRPALRYSIVGLLTILVALEFLTFNPFQDNRTWSYSQTHPFYVWLKEQKDVDIIAEYPLNEPGRTAVSTAYFRDQYVHGKRVINAYTSASPMAVLRNGLRDLSDPQTPSALAALGVNLVVVHGEDKKPITVAPGLEEVDWNHSDIDKDSIYIEGQMKVYKVTAQKDVDSLVLVPGKGFSEFARINSTYTEAGYVFNTHAELGVFDLKQGHLQTPAGRHTVSLKAISDNDPIHMSAKQGDRIVWEGEITNATQSIEFAIEAGKNVVLTLENKQNSSVVISDLDLK